MSKDILKAALDDALRDGIKHCFVELVNGASDKLTPEAQTLGRFRVGVRLHLESFKRAQAVIDEFGGA